MMKKTFLSLAGIAVALTLSVSSAHAIQISDDGSSVGLIDSTHTVSGVFDLTSQYNSSAFSMGGATASFVFSNNGNNTAVDVRLDGLSTGTGIIPLTFLWFFNVPVQFTVSGAAKDDLVNTGILSYSISLNDDSSGASIYLTGATLTATVTAKSPAENAVPDGGTTLSLLGLALTGLGLARRKFKA